MTVAPTASIASRIPVTLWAGKLSMITQAPGQRLGTKTCATYVLKANPSVAPGALSSLPPALVAPLHQSMSCCYRVGRERRYKLWSLLGREHNAKVIAKLQPVPPFKHQILQIHGSNLLPILHSQHLHSFCISFSCMQSFFSW